MTGKHLTNEQIDELILLQNCLSAIADLMTPCPDLHIVDRDKIALLLNYLTERLALVMEGGE